MLHKSLHFSAVCSTWMAQKVITSLHTFSNFHKAFSNSAKLSQITVFGIIALHACAIKWKLIINFNVCCETLKKFTQRFPNVWTFSPFVKVLTCGCPLSPLNVCGPGNHIPAAAELVDFRWFFNSFENLFLMTNESDQMIWCNIHFCKAWLSQEIDRRENTCLATISSKTFTVVYECNTDSVRAVAGDKC